jgi:hypothetical protein
MSREKTPLEIVQDLNEKLWNKYERDDVWFSYTLDNLIDSVSFNSFGENHNIKIDLWNSENSQQEYREETGDYEPLEDTIMREFKMVLENLKGIKIK